MTGSFNKAEYVLQALFVKQIYLWPRFHVEVSKILDKRAPEVIELHVPLSDSMKAIQSAVIKLIGICLTYLQECQQVIITNHQINKFLTKPILNQLDTTELTLENGFFKHFDEIIRQQLDPIWLSVDPKTKQIISDLKSLRSICTHLVCSFKCFLNFPYIHL